MSGAVAGTVYAPGTGSAGNFLSPGTYIISLFFVFYNSNATTTTTITINFGVSSNSSTTPTTGGTNIINFTAGGFTLSNLINSTSFTQNFVFTVTSSAYYYGFISSASPSTTGVFAIGIKTINIVRIA